MVETGNIFEHPDRRKSDRRRADTLRRITSFDIAGILNIDLPFENTIILFEKLSIKLSKLLFEEKDYIEKFLETLDLEDISGCHFEEEFSDFLGSNGVNVHEAEKYFNDLFDLHNNIHKGIDDIMKDNSNIDNKKTSIRNLFDLFEMQITARIHILNNYVNGLKKDSKTGLKNETSLSIDIKEKDITGLYTITIMGTSDLKGSNGITSRESIIKECRDSLNIIKKHISNNDIELYFDGNKSFYLAIFTQDQEIKDKIEIFIQKIIEGISIEGINRQINFAIGYADIKYGKENLLDNSQQAQHLSKLTWDNMNNPHVIFFNENIRDKIISDNNAEELINRAIDNDGFEVFYQPIVTTNNGIVNKYECLIRIIKDGTVHSPGEFMEIAKRRHYMVSITYKMIDNAFKFMENKNIDFSINLASCGKKTDEIIDYIFQKLDEHNIQGNRLTVEILEDVQLPERALFNIVKRLRERKIKIAIDDFGTGHNEAAKILEIQPDYLKIDGSVTRGIDSADFNKSRMFLQFILHRGRTLESTIIAEFVDKEAKRKLLEERGVELCQGYLFSKPMSPQELETELAKKSKKIA